MSQIVTKPEHGESIVSGEQASPQMQLFLDDIVLQLNNIVLGNAFKLPDYSVASVPDATQWFGAMIYVNDETGGAVPAFSDGTDWRRVTDRTVIS